LIYFVLLIVVTFFVLLFGMQKKAEILFSPVLGFMFGSLISYEEYEEETDYTIQCCIGFISITIIWTHKTNG
tara:strand:+ start:988 stop:1203 length:216 start_codon:yes stop_codon:yes gene_type:complete